MVHDEVRGAMHEVGASKDEVRARNWQAGASEDELGSSEHEVVASFWEAGAREDEVGPSEHELVGRFERVVRFGRVTESITLALRRGNHTRHRSYTGVRCCCRCWRLLSHRVPVKIGDVPKLRRQRLRDDVLRLAHRLQR